MKAEEGLCNGQVLYHQHITKPAKEVEEKTREIKDREELREQRRKQQVFSKIVGCSQASCFSSCHCMSKD